jgi:hypothetical protein
MTPTMKPPMWFNSNNRGSSEVIFIGLFTIFVASAGIGGMAVVNE